MAKTFAEMQAQVSGSFGGRQDKLDLIKALLNDAQREIAKENWEELLRAEDYALTITADAEADSTVVLPTNFGDLHSVVQMVSGISRPVRNVRPAQWFDYIPQDSWDQYRGIPAISLLGSTTLKVYPPVAEASALRVLYYIEPSDMVADADVSELRGKDQMMVAYAASRLADDLEKPQQASRFWTQYLGLLNAEKSRRQPSRRDLRVASAEAPRLAGDPRIPDFS